MPRCQAFAETKPAPEPAPPPDQETAIITIVTKDGSDKGAEEAGDQDDDGQEVDLVGFVHINRRRWSLVFGLRLSLSLSVCLSAVVFLSCSYAVIAFSAAATTASERVRDRGCIGGGSTC